MGLYVSEVSPKGSIPMVTIPTLLAWDPQPKSDGMLEEDGIGEKRQMLDIKLLIHKVDKVGKGGPVAGIPGL